MFSANRAREERERFLKNQCKDHLNIIERSIKTTCSKGENYITYKLKDTDKNVDYILQRLRDEGYNVTLLRDRDIYQLGIGW